MASVGDAPSIDVQSASNENFTHIVVMGLTGVQLRIPLVDDCILMRDIEYNFGADCRLEYECADGDWKGISGGFSIDPTKTKLTRPIDGWGQKTYHVVRMDSKPSRRCSPVNVMPAKALPAVIRQNLTAVEEHRLRKLWNERIFNVFCGASHGSGVLIDEQRVLTAGHIGFEVGGIYTIRGLLGEFNNAKCVWRSNAHNFAVLSCSDLPELPLHFAELGPGRDYFLMGFLNEADHPSVSKGRITGVLSVPCLSGTPGIQRGFLGGPVFDMDMFLCGIIVGPVNDVSSIEKPTSTILSINFILGKIDVSP